MSISAEEKVCYLREAAIVLAKEGFQLDEVHTDRLCILLDGAPLCEVTESGGIAYRNMVRRIYELLWNNLCRHRAALQSEGSLYVSA